MEHDRSPCPPFEFDVTVEVFSGQGILETARDGVLGQTVQQTRHMIVGAVHGEVVVQAEPLRRYTLHGLGLVDDILEGRQVELHPCVALIGVVSDGRSHPLRMRTDRPGRHRNPRSMFLAEQLINRHASGLAHQIVHRRPQAKGCLVPHPGEGIRPQIALDRLLRFGALAFTQPDESIVGAYHIDRAPSHVVIVTQLVGAPIDIAQPDLARFDRCDFHCVTLRVRTRNTHISCTMRLRKLKLTPASFATKEIGSGAFIFSIERLNQRSEVMIPALGSPPPAWARIALHVGFQ